MVAKKDNSGRVITINSSGAIAPFTYRASLKFDSLGRLVITG